MWPVSEAYADTVKASNGLDIAVDIYRGGVPMYRGVPVEGSITVDSRAATRRTCDLILPPFLRQGYYGAIATLPEPTYDNAVPVLGTTGHELRITHSLVTSDGSQLSVPVGRFRVQDLDGSELGITEINLLGVSREAYVVDDKFASPRTVQGPSATALITTLIHESLPQAVVSVTATGDHPVEPTTEDRDRWGLIERIATQIGAVVYASPDGRFVIQDAPTLATLPVWVFEMGASGSLIDVHRLDSRREVRNDIYVIGATPAGSTAPVSGHARDTNPASSTLWGDPDDGAWGKAVEVIHVPGLTSNAQCTQVAEAEIAKRAGTSSGLDLSAVPHAGLEGLDVVDVIVDSSITGRPMLARRHVLDRFTLPLTAGGDFPVNTRDLRSVILGAA